jgi:hypothetical protein
MWVDLGGSQSPDRTSFRALYYAPLFHLQRLAEVLILQVFNGL